VQLAWSSGGFVSHDGEEQMDQRVPSMIHPLLEEYIQWFEHELPGCMAGLYLYGSIALGAFDERFSDIDFLTLLHRRPTPTEVERLAMIHQRLERTYPRWRLEGSYLQWDDVGRFEEEIVPFPYYHDGVLHLAGHFEVNAVTWWVLKNRGIAIVGPAAQDLHFTVDWELLLLKMRENLNSYWASWTRERSRLAHLLTDDGVQWTVLGVLRLWYTFREQGLISKIGAGRYALAHLPARWSPLIHEAIAIREGRQDSGYPSRALRAVEVVRFVRYVIKVCNEERQREAATF